MQKEFHFRTTCNILWYGKSIKKVVCSASMETPMLVKIKCLSSLDYQAEQTMASAAWLLIAKSSLFDKEKSNDEIAIHLKVQWRPEATFCLNSSTTIR